MKKEKLKKIIINLINFIIPYYNIDKKIYDLYRRARKNYLKGHNLLADYYINKIYKKYCCIISSKAEIGENLKLPHPLGIVIGSGVKIGSNCWIYQNVTIGRKAEEVCKYPSIGDNVKIYSGAVLVGNIKIGDNAIIGANSFVMQDVPNNAIAVGSPARIIQREKK